MTIYKSMRSLFVVMLLSLQGCAFVAGAAAGGAAGVMMSMIITMKMNLSTMSKAITITTIKSVERGFQ